MPKEPSKKKTKEYRLKNRDKMRAYQKDWHLKNRDLRLARNRENYLKNKEEYLIRHIKNRRKIRIKVLDILGGKCVQCGFSDSRALHVDHIHNNGAKERRTISNEKIYRKILRMSKKDREAEYQLLCANCNIIKRFI